MKWKKHSCLKPPTRYPLLINGIITDSDYGSFPHSLRLAPVSLMIFSSQMRLRQSTVSRCRKPQVFNRHTSFLKPCSAMRSSCRHRPGDLADWDPFRNSFYMFLFNGNFRILKWRYCTTKRPYIGGIFPYIGLIYGFYHVSMSSWENYRFLLDFPCLMTGKMTWFHPCFHGPIQSLKMTWVKMTKCWLKWL